MTLNGSYKILLKTVPWNSAFWPTAVVDEADGVNSVSASACHIGGPKDVSPGQKALRSGFSFHRFADLVRFPKNPVF